MKIKEFRCKCGHDDFFFADKGNQIGIYCSYCGKWLKWADKDEQNLRMKQDSVLDKIEEEINSSNRGTCDYFIVDRIEEIINKYKAEMEGE
jgi:glycine betaine/choline ABC-type transport system substrate-binding protein